MKRNIKKTIHWIIAFSTISLITACSEPESTGEEMSITGTIVTSENFEGKTFHVSMFHAQSGIGFQQHPLYEIESFTTQSPNFEHSFLYSPEGNTGLVVYAWLDDDGDGINCTVSSRNDVAGADVNEDFPNSKKNYSIELTDECVGPDWFYPAAD